MREPWSDRLQRAFGRDFRSRADLIREASLTPGEVAAAERAGLLERAPVCVVRVRSPAADPPEEPYPLREAEEDLAMVLELVDASGEIRGGRAWDGSYYSPIGVWRTIRSTVDVMLAAGYMVPDLALALYMSKSPEF